MSERVLFHPFPLAGIDAMTASTARSYPRHTHDQYGIGVVDAGGHASSSGRGEVEAGPGSLIFVNPGEVHDGHAIQGRPRSWRMLYVDPDLLSQALADIGGGTHAPLAFAAPVFADERLRRLFDAAFAHALSNGPHDAMACETAILHLAAGMRANAAACEKTAPGPAAPIRRARERIDDDPTAPLTLTSLAGEARLSRYQLLRGFARELGLPPHAYLLQQRIALARRLIRSGHTLAETAALAGFFDQSHLTRCFTRQFGITPSRYAAAAG
ncbi:AraC family transcriptional regulator [Rhodanobacter umsongensis]|uniref:AraC family transcriptional regulator n=1 Tax=Rhodanobacter umsongensis TaxID=633153 RepID=A0ABW0JH95_9GAMM